MYFTSKLRVIVYDTEFGIIKVIYRIVMGSFVVFGVDLVQLSTSINWALVFYVIFSVATTIYGTFRLYESGGSVRSSIYGIGATLIFVFFGYRWFSNPTIVSKKWPPVINMCPDYLTFVPSVQGSSSGGCVDMLGVTKSNGGIQVSHPSDISSMSTGSNKLFPYTSKDVEAAKSSSDLQPICDMCKTKGVTWEGVYDGDVCTAIKTVDATNAAISKCVASV